MDLSLSSNQGTLTVASEAPSLTFLIERGIYCTRQGYYANALTFFALAREQLTPDQIHFAVILDALIQSSASYMQAHDALLQAERNFAKADVEQQTRLATLSKLLSASEEAINNEQFPEIQPGESFQHDQSSSDSDPHQILLPSRSYSDECKTLPDLYITCFGRFEVYWNSQPVVLCSNRKGQAILRYLIAQSDYHATADKLMGILWSEDEPVVARHKLHVAVSALRGSLNKGYECDPGGGYILCKKQFYQINPAVSLRSDVDEFLALYQAGRDTSGRELATFFERACHLYIGPFLIEDMYADWSFIRREQLSQTYLTMCRALADYFLSVGRYEDTVKWANTILSESQYDEAAYRQLMLAYAAQRRSSEALRQYQRCEHVLHDELGVSPMPETVYLFQAIMTGKQVFSPSIEIERK